MDLGERAVDVMRVALFVVVILVGFTLARGSLLVVVPGFLGLVAALAALYLRTRRPR